MREIDKDDLITHKVAMVGGGLGAVAIVLFSMFWIMPDMPALLFYPLFVFVGPIGAAVFFGVIYGLLWPLMKAEQFLRTRKG